MTPDPLPCWRDNNAAIDGTHGDGLLDRLVPTDADDLSGEPGLPQGQAQ